jgi:CDP-glucose 4,6-dehydratase
MNQGSTDYPVLMEKRLGEALRRAPGPVLITGHTGFKGTWLTLLLENLGIEVVGLSLPPTKDSLYSIASREGKITESFTNINNLKQVEKFFKTTKPSYIFHFAAQSLVLESYKNPVETFETNVMGTVNVLSAAFASNSVEGIIVATTDKVYENLESGKHFVESDPLRGKDPYSASKVSTESVVDAWRQIAENIGGPTIVAVRAGNVIGGGDLSKDRLLPDVVRAIRANKPIKIRNPKSVRPWQHVLDPLRGYIMAAETHSHPEKISAAYNFGPNDIGITVENVVNIFLEEWGDSTISTEVIQESQNLEAKNLQIDSQRANKELNWFQSIEQTKAIVLTSKWWKEVLTGKMSAIEACKLDIAKVLSTRK